MELQEYKALGREWKPKAFNFKGNPESKEYVQAVATATGLTEGRALDLICVSHAQGSKQAGAEELAKLTARLAELEALLTEKEQTIDRQSAETKTALQNANLVISDLEKQLQAATATPKLTTEEAVAEKIGETAMQAQINDLHFDLSQARAEYASLRALNEEVMAENEKLRRTQQPAAPALKPNECVVGFTDEQLEQIGKARARLEVMSKGATIDDPAAILHSCVKEWNHMVDMFKDLSTQFSKLP